VAIVARAGFDLLSRPRVLRFALRASAVPGLRRAAYEAANVEFVRRHVMRGRPRDAPLCIFRSFAGMNRRVYETMWGPSEYFPTGVLKDWDVSGRLGEIDVPTLITSGRHDEATPRQMRVLRDGIRGARWVVFEHSAHAALVEERARYLAVVEDFLRSVEVRNAGEAVLEARR
jgi:L-proline amide hydrolase